MKTATKKAAKAQAPTHKQGVPDHEIRRLRKIERVSKAAAKAHREWFDSIEFDESILQKWDSAKEAWLNLLAPKSKAVKS